LGGATFEGETVFTKAQVVSLYDVTDRTIERYLASHEDELKSNGYQILKGKKLRGFKGLLDGTDINDGTKTSILGVFSFRAVLIRSISEQAVKQVISINKKSRSHFIYP
tara:strand:- start:49 stop:375 length:327 start_codon:yes stop_codon:yes gene_type:complete